MVKEKTVKKEKKGKVKKENMGKNRTNVNQDTLIIDSAEYKTLYTKKYLNRKKYKTPDPNQITAFIPGTILDIFVKIGQKVQKGDELLILEAMKMNNKIIAPHDATIKKIHVKSGEMVSREHLLLELKS